MVGGVAEDWRGENENGGERDGRVRIRGDAVITRENKGGV